VAEAVHPSVSWPFGINTANTGTALQFPFFFVCFLPDFCLLPLIRFVAPPPLHYC